MFTWDRTSVLDWRTAKGGGVTGFYPKWLVVACMYNQDSFSGIRPVRWCVFNKRANVAKHVFQLPLARVFVCTFSTPPVFPSVKASHYRAGTVSGLILVLFHAECHTCTSRLVSVISRKWNCFVLGFFFKILSGALLQ